MKKIEKSTTHTHRKFPAQVEQNDTMIHEMKHIQLKFDLEEIRKLLEKDPHYAKLIENIKLKNEKIKEITI